MGKVECPICHQMHDENVMCPNCSFEIHQFFLQPGKFQEIEEKRISAHSKWWKELQDKMVDRSEYNKKEQKLMELNSRISELEQTLASKEINLSTLQKELDEVKKRCENLENENLSLKEENTRLSQSIDLLNEKVKKLEEDLNKSDEENSSLNAIIQGLNERLKEKENRINELEREIERLKNNQPHGHIIVMQGGHYTQVLPFYKGTTVIGRHPKDLENNCRITTSCKDLQNEHFRLTVTDDEKTIVKLLEGCSWKIEGEGAQITECELYNGSIITVGNLSLILNFK